MFDLLGQILPAAGAVAGGMVEGQKLYDDRARLMQVMALAKAEEERRSTLHPLQVRSMQLSNQAAELPLRQPRGNLIGEVAGGLGVQQEDLAGMTHPEAVDMLGALFGQRESTKRAGMVNQRSSLDDLLDVIKLKAGLYDQPVLQQRQTVADLRREIDNVRDAMSKARSTDRPGLKFKLDILEEQLNKALDEQNQAESAQRNTKASVGTDLYKYFGVATPEADFSQEEQPSMFGRAR